jgi:hypothetical protein
VRVRPILASSLILAVAASGVAGAAGRSKSKPRPVCNLVNDPTTDAPFDPSLGIAKSAAKQDPDADIVSADLASNAKYVTAVIRVRSLAFPDATWPEAHFYLVQWNVPGHSNPVYLGATIDPNPASAAYGPQFVFGDLATVNAVAVTSTYYNISSAKVKGTVDTAKNTITLSVPIAQLSGYGSFKPGTPFSAITAGSQQLANAPVFPTNVPDVGGSPSQGFQSDVDNASKDYTAGTPSCVTPGA